jgi:DNA-binding CsgD family transcriptional regulator
MYFEQLGHPSLPSKDALKQIFQLTEREIHVVLFIASGGKLQTAAHEMEITYETARNHLRSAFQKTDTHSQTELAILMLQAAKEGDLRK